MNALRSVALMLSVKHTLHQSFEVEVEQARKHVHESRRARRAILSGSRLCACGRRISGNKHHCLACAAERNCADTETVLIACEEAQ